MFLLVCQQAQGPLLSRFKPRSNGAHATGEIILGHQPALEHGMDECEQLSFRAGDLAIHGLCKLILRAAPLQSRKHPANRETLAHRDQTRFPGWVWIGDAVAWCNDIHSFSSRRMASSRAIRPTSMSLPAFIRRPFHVARYGQDGAPCGPGERLRFCQAAAGQYQSCSRV